MTMTSSNKPLTARQKKQEQRIFDACRQLIEESGGEAATMRDLALRSGVSKATLFNRYGSKDSLMSRAIQNEYQEYIQKPVSQAFLQGTPLQQVIQSANIMARETRRRKPFTTVLIGAHFRLDNDREMPGQLYATMVSTWTQPLSRMRLGVDLHAWVCRGQLAEELSDRLYSVSIKWAQGGISDRLYPKRALYSVLMSVVASSTGAQYEQALAQLKALAPAGQRKATRRI